MSSQNLSSKNLTTSVIKNVNVKPLNSATVPATVTVGGRRVRRVKKSKPYSLFSFAGRKSLKSRRRPKKVKSSRRTLVVGGKSKKGRTSRSRSHKGGKKTKRSKSRVSVGGKSKRRSHKRH